MFRSISEFALSSMVHNNQSHLSVSSYFWQFLHRLVRYYRHHDFEEPSATRSVSPKLFLVIESMRRDLAKGFPFSKSCTETLYRYVFLIAWIEILFVDVLKALGTVMKHVLCITVRGLLWRYFFQVKTMYVSVPTWAIWGQNESGTSWSQNCKNWWPRTTLGS